MVWGDGGAGKSAVAYEFATRIRDMSPDDYLVAGWVSAKSEEFREGQSRVIRPDFTTIPSAIASLLGTLYPWELDDARGDEAKNQASLLRNIDEMPALVVIDDIDTILENAALVEFLTYGLTKNKSKFLFTSRTKLHTLQGTEVCGFSGDELAEFLASRCVMYEVPKEAALERMKHIESVTRGYPLYIDDLLRLASVMPLEQAIEEWGHRKGDAARSYALERQLARLGGATKDVVIAVCRAKSPVSLLELTNVVGMGEEDVIDAVRQLRESFLVSSATGEDAVPRFEMNNNTRRLVESTFRKDPTYREIGAAFAAITGDIKSLIRTRTIGSSISRAAVYLRQGEGEQAIEVLDGALDQSPNDPDLLGAKGWIYKSMKPPKLELARQSFDRAYQLGASKLDTYWHWAMMETDEVMWPEAIAAAEKGLEKVGNHADLLFLAGHARSRLAKRLQSEFQHARALTEASKAHALLVDAIGALKESGGTTPLGRSYRATVLNLEMLEKWDEVAHYLTKWRQDAAEAIQESEAERLSYNYPQVRQALAAQQKT